MEVLQLPLTSMILFYDSFSATFEPEYGYMIGLSENLYLTTKPYSLTCLQKIQVTCIMKSGKSCNLLVGSFD